MNKNIFIFDKKRKSLILIVGKNGTGKTSVSNGLVKHFKKSFFFDTDKHFHKIGFNVEKSQRHKNKLNEIKKAFKKFRVIINDYTFYDKKTRKLYYDFSKALDLNLILIELKAPKNIIKKRLKMNKSSKGRWENYLLVDRNYKKINEPHISINNENSINKTIKKVLNYLFKIGLTNNQQI